MTQTQHSPSPDLTPQYEDASGAVGVDESPTAEIAAAIEDTATPATPAEFITVVTTQTISGAKFSLLSVSHAYIDIFPILLATLLWPLRERLGLNEWQVTAVLMISPICSGALQPLFAWLSDRYDSRIGAPLGLLIGALAIGSIGFAQNFWQLIMLQTVGVICTGMYHPIATAQAGQIGASLFRNGRAQAIGLFIGAGMLGTVLGAKLGPGLNASHGMTSLIWLAAPALLIAVILHAKLRTHSHMSAPRHQLRASLTRAESNRRWRIISLLASQNAMRFTVQVALQAVIINVWAKSKILADSAALAVPLTEREIAAQASILNGNIVAALTLGMGIGVFLAGRHIPRGHERAPLIWMSLVGAIATALIPIVGDATYSGNPSDHLALLPVYLCACIGSIGFFATFPIATGLAQRLQPGHTSLVTALMMGVGWAISSIAPLLAILFFAGVSIDHAPELPPDRINIAFLCFAAILIIAGLSTLLIPRDLIAKAADNH